MKVGDLVKFFDDPFIGLIYDKQSCGPLLRPQYYIFWNDGDFTIEMDDVGLKVISEGW